MPLGFLQNPKIIPYFGEGLSLFHLLKSQHKSLMDCFQYFSVVLCIIITYIDYNIRTYVL